MNEDLKDGINALGRSEMKSIVKEAIHEWLDDQARKFGKWSLKYLAVAGLGAFVYLILLSKGWSIK